MWNPESKSSGTSSTRSRSESPITSVANSSVKKLHFFIGKGGVGKTTVALAAASSWAKQGKKVLYLEIGERSSVSAIAGIKPLIYDARSLGQNLWGAKITGAEAMRDYLLRQIRVERLYKIFFENRPVRYFFEVAPTLRDLMILGKIVHDFDSKEPPGPYEVIVVDAPATGHGLFLLNAARIVKDLTSFGPVFQRALHISETLESEETTEINLVTLARPIVIGETLELLSGIRKLGVPLGTVYVNRVLPTAITYRQTEFRDLISNTSNEITRLLARRSGSEARELSHLRKRVRVPLQVLIDRPGLASLGELSDWYEGAA